MGSWHQTVQTSVTCRRELLPSPLATPTKTREALLLDVQRPQITWLGLCKVNIPPAPSSGFNYQGASEPFSVTSTTGIQAQGTSLVGRASTAIHLFSLTATRYIPTISVILMHKMAVNDDLRAWTVFLRLSPHLDVWAFSTFWTSTLAVSTRLFLRRQNLLSAGTGIDWPHIMYLHFCLLPFHRRCALDPAPPLSYHPTQVQLCAWTYHH